MMAKVNPVVIADRARPRRSDPPSAAAYPLAAGMKLAADSANNSRAANSAGQLGDRAASRLPTVKPPMAMASKRRRSSPAVKTAIMGACAVGEGKGGDQMTGGGQTDVQISS